MRKFNKKKIKKEGMPHAVFCSVLNKGLFYTALRPRVWSSSKQLCFLKPNLVIMLTGVNTREHHLPGSIQTLKLHYPSLSSSHFNKKEGIELRSRQRQLKHGPFELEMT